MNLETARTLFSELGRTLKTQDREIRGAFVRELRTGPSTAQPFADAVSVLRADAQKRRKKGRP